MKKRIMGIMFFMMMVSETVNGQAEKRISFPNANLYSYLDTVSEKIGASMNCGGNPDFERNGVWDPYYLCQVYYDVTVYDAVSEYNARTATLQIEPLLDVEKTDKGGFIQDWNNSNAYPDRHIEFLQRTPIKGYALYYKLPVLYTNRDIQVAASFFKEFYEGLILIEGNPPQNKMQQQFLALAALDENEQIVSGQHYFSDGVVTAVFVLGAEVELLYVTCDQKFDISEWPATLENLTDHFSRVNEDLEKGLR